MFSGLTFDPTVTFGVVISVITFIFAYVRTRRQALDDRFEKFEIKNENKLTAIDSRLQEGSRRMDRHDLRVHELQQIVAQLPAKDDLHVLQIKLTEIVGEMKAINAKIEGNAETMERIEKMVIRHDKHIVEGA